MKTTEQNLEEAQRDLEDNKLQIAKLVEIKYLFSIHPEYEIAELLHAKMCNWNHTDGCSWFYEKWGDLGYARNTYITRAKRVLAVIDRNTAKKVIEAM